MQAIFRLPEFCEQDATLFWEQVQRYREGAVSAAEFRSFRVPLGVYEQRENDTYMLRVRFPAGGVLPHQMRALADVSRRCGSGVLHVTSRQDIQVHQVLLDDVPAAFEALYKVGLSTRGGGGNTVRNITGCYDAGVCPDEVFDPSPYAVAVSEFLLPDPLSYQLPRKYKIAFSGCARDCAGATVNDLGFIARWRDGEPGFAVYVGGGMGASSRVADLFEEFVPAGDVHLVAEAVKRVFDKHGNRKNRNKARLRFLIETIGLDRFRRLYEGELAGLRNEGVPGLDVRLLPEGTRSVPDDEGKLCPAFAEWRQKNVVPQRQTDYFLVHISLELGDIDAATLEKLADVVEQHAEGMLRTTQTQNLVVRWVHENELPQLHRKLSDLGLATADPLVLRNMVACTGAATCRLGICLARGLATALRKHLQTDGVDLDGVGDLRIHISGCPNACGRHPIADIGLFGAARRVQGRLMPHYVLQIGGKVAEGHTRLARGDQPMPAKNATSAVAELLRAFQRSKEFPDFARFVEVQTQQIESGLITQHRNVPDAAWAEDYYLDWDANEPFSLAGRGAGECGAGVFDLIEVDLSSAQESLQQGRFFEATVLAARCLLVTRGEQARDAADALRLFSRFFLDEKLVAGEFSPLIDEAERAAKASQPHHAFAPDKTGVARFVEAVQNLYDSMDPSLRFKPLVSPVAMEAEVAVETEVAPAADRDADLRGVVCPLNYVKTKMLLEQMKTGEILSVLLDEPGTRNVPDSVKKDGHGVLAIEEQEGHWRIQIRKG